MKRLMLRLTFTVLGIMLTVNASAKTIVTDGLVSYWTFDRNTINGRTVADVWGENDATIVGNPTITGGYLKHGIKLDGRDYVSLPNVGNFGSQIGPYTFEAWFKTSYKERWSAIFNVIERPCDRNSAGHGILINATLDRRINHGFVTAKDGILTQISIKKGGNGCFNSIRGREKVISDGEWHHIVWTSRPLNKVELEKEKLRNTPFARNPKGCVSPHAYFDMELISGGPACTLLDEIRPYTEPIYLGAMNDQGKAFGFFQGVFDEVRIYDRALTEEEVIRNYQSAIGLSVEPIQKLSTVWGALKTKR